MKKYLRINLVGDAFPYEAVEYESEIFLKHEIPIPVESRKWEARFVGTEELITALYSRGWHQTDIGDALFEARQQA
jgi:hypothetical protein